MKISAEKLTQFARQFLQHAGSSVEEATIVATHLIEANLKGHDSHGIGMLTQYTKSIKNGFLKPNTSARHY